MKKIVFEMIFVLFTVFNLYSKDDNLWMIRAKNFEKYNGITLANGCIGLVSGREPFSISETVLGNVFDRDKTTGISCLVNPPSFMSLGIKIDGCSIKSDNIGMYEQTLDMKTATMVSCMQNEKVSVRYTLMAIGNLPYMAMGIVEVFPKKDITIEVYNDVEENSNLEMFSSAFKVMNDLQTISPVITTNSFTKVTKKQISTCSAFLFENEEELKSVRGGNNGIYFEKKLKKDTKYRFALIGSVCSSRYFDDPIGASERFVVFALRKRIDELLSGHIGYWDDMWKGDIVVDGNAEDQRDIRLALYHLYSFQRKDFRLSIPPMGLSSAGGYNGHVFWDSEIWMYPPVLLLNPHLAKSHLDYRYDRLKKAKEKALMFGYKGAMYPWESDDSGEESTPSWCLTGPFEHHISADISIAFWNYYCVTKDKEWLRNEGYNVIREVADFWKSRVCKNKDGSYSIKNVVGANEYAHNVDDNAYTNGAAKVSLENAVKASYVIGMTPDPLWSEIACRIKFHYMENGTTKEHERYDGEMIKQADVNLLAYPLKIVKRKADIERDLTYYQNKIDKINGPAMGNSILSILYCKIGDRDKAYEMFKKSYVSHKRPPFGVLSESPSSDNPYFATGAGGLLQAVLFGFAGIEITDEGIRLGSPLLPRQWKSLTIKGLYGYNKDYVITNKQ